MNKAEIKLITSLVLEMNDRLQLITKIYPKDSGEEHLLKHLAAMAIHLAMFTRDLEGSKTKDSKLEKKFLDECGCKEELGKVKND